MIKLYVKYFAMILLEKTSFFDTLDSFFHCTISSSDTLKVADVHSPHSLLFIQRQS